MKAQLRICRWMIGVFACVVLTCSLRAGETEAGQAVPAVAPAPAPVPPNVPTTNAPTRKQDLATAEQSPGVKAELPAAVEEVLRMFQAGISPEVIKAYIASSTAPYKLSPADIIALKSQGVPDELTTAMLKHGASAAGQVSPPSIIQLPPASGASRPRTVGGFDPESYDYFQYYYLYPRTIASANQRLLGTHAPYATYGAYPYGGYWPLPFHPLPPASFPPPQ
jgi:hypothetical protein